VGSSDGACPFGFDLRIVLAAGFRFVEPRLNLPTFCSGD
jgi:hypothetical protein